MFWRRRRLPEDDEPLIPRGMIWQATGDDSPEEQPPVMQEQAPKNAAIIPDKLAPMPVKAAEVPQLGNPADLTSNLLIDPGTLTPPRGWPRVDEAEVARRSQSIDTAVSFPHRKPLLSSAVPNSFEEEHAPITEPTPLRPSLVATAPRAPIQETAWEEREWEDPASAELQANVQTDFQAKVETDEPQSVGAPADWQPQQARALAAPRPSVLSRLRSSSAKSAAFATQSAAFATQSVTARFEAWRQASSVAMANATSRLQHSWQRARAVKVTLRIPSTSLRLFTGIRSHAQAMQARTQMAMGSHENLWTSLAMAALSVLLALGVVAGLRRYDPAYTAAASETATATTAAPSIRQASVPAKAAGAPHSKPKPSPMVVREAASARNPLRPPVIAASRKTAIAPGISPTVAAKAKPRVRRRRSEDDDYVAADTYVRYGSNGKRTR